tara:strand:- start:346 stop:597 length:252 start_codon:yes stop_codon:yes gene_type:complete
MIYSNLPNEIKLHIINYILVKCDECKNERKYDEIKRDVTTIYYKAIFDDDFPFPRFYKSYNFLCINCINNLKKEYIKPLNDCI